MVFLYKTNTKCSEISIPVCYFSFFSTCHRRASKLKRKLSSHDARDTFSVLLFRELYCKDSKSKKALYNVEWSSRTQDVKYFLNFSVILKTH